MYIIESDKYHISHYSALLYPFTIIHMNRLVVLRSTLPHQEVMWM